MKVILMKIYSDKRYEWYKLLKEICYWVGNDVIVRD